MVYSQTIKVSNLGILIYILLFSLTLQADINVNIYGGVNHSIHGVNIVKETLFGENVGSGGYGGADKINATWFRSTSPCNILRGAVESTNTPGYPDKAWLADKYPLSGLNNKNFAVADVFINFNLNFPVRKKCINSFS